MPLIVMCSPQGLEKEVKCVVRRNYVHKPVSAQARKLRRFWQFFRHDHGLGGTSGINIRHKKTAGRSAVFEYNVLE
jgi:hypothetical protein